MGENNQIQPHPINDWWDTAGSRIPKSGEGEYGKRVAYEAWVASEKAVYDRLDKIDAEGGMSAIAATGVVAMMVRLRAIENELEEDLVMAIRSGSGPLGLEGVARLEAEAFRLRNDMRRWWAQARAAEA